MHVLSRWRLLALPEFSVCDMERRRLTLKHAWQLTPCCYRSSRPGYPQAVQLSITFRLLQVRAMHKRHIYTRNSAHELSVKLGPCIHVCSHTDSSCPGFWHMWSLAIYLSRYLLMRDKSSFVQWLISLLLAQACPTMMNHHTSSRQETRMIGLSLGEPHTSGTALRKCVNIRTCLLAAIYCKF